VRVGGIQTNTTTLKGLATVVGTVLQDPTRQLVASTVPAELTFGPENLGLDRDEIGRRLVSVVAASGLEPLMERNTDELSGGEAQQIAIGGALMLRPQLLVLDEPLANLDPAAASRLLALVRRLADEGTAVVVVEHRIEDVLEARPDRALYLEDGESRYLGSMDGFLETADPTRVKLPFDAWLRRARSMARRPRRGASELEPRAAMAADRDTPPRLEWRHGTPATTAAPSFTTFRPAWAATSGSRSWDPTVRARRRSSRPRSGSDRFLVARSSWTGFPLRDEGSPSWRPRSATSSRTRRRCCSRPP
jgi:energy-coupling factor transport system ATP-binding protein